MRVGHYTRSICIDGRHLGPKNVAVIEGWPQNRGSLSIILNGNAVGTKVSGRYREGGRLSGVLMRTLSLTCHNALSCHCC